MVYIQWALLDEFDKEVPNWERVCLLINACPNLCRVELYQNGMLPLHVAIAYNVPLYVIKVLVEKWDSPVMNCPKFDDWLPLHMACNANAPLEVLQYLLELSRGGTARETNCDGYTPQCILIKNEQELDVVHCVAEAWPGVESVYTFSTDEDNE